MGKGRPLIPAERRRIFLLSPAHAGGERSLLLLRENAAFDLAVKLRNHGAPIGEVFGFISGLYFRGKMEYARAFASPPDGVPGAFVITAGRGLVPPDTTITAADLREIASIPVDVANPAYREPLERDCRILHDAAGPACDFVLLGSVASFKYLKPLFSVFGDRLLFPEEFVGRGDMSRGGLLLRSARSAIELRYEPVGEATRHGARPPRLPKIERASGSARE